MLESLLSGVASDSAIERLSRWRASRPKAYATAVGIVAIATLVRWLLDPHIYGVAPFITYFAAVLMIALVAGLGPSLLAIACFVVLGWYLFVPPYFNLDLTKSDPTMLAIFAMAAALMAMLIALVNSIVERLLQQRRELLALREREGQAQQLMIRELQHRTRWPYPSGSGVRAACGRYPLCCSRCLTFTKTGSTLMDATLS